MENPETAVCVNCAEPLLGCAVRRVLGELMHTECANAVEQEYNEYLDGTIPPCDQVLDPIPE
jgi:hypothetical protein